MRSKLFVPGSRPELFEKAWLSEADALSFDLEDAVAASAKDQARKYVADVLDGPALGPRRTIIVRVNSLESSRFDDDIDAVVRSELDVLNMPKVESADAVRAVSDQLASLEASRGLGKQSDCS